MWQVCRRVLLGGLLASPLAATQAPGPRGVEPLAIGETFTLHSAVLGELRRVNVYTPAAYSEHPDQRFPVLYMPDGGIEEDFLHVAGLVQILSLNGSMRPVILVGIENTERRRDMTGPTATDRDREIAPRVGGSADFRSFIRHELMPAINDGYRTSGETAIVGESLAGLFVVETLLTEPDLFDTYLAIDPSLWWDSERLVNTAIEMLGGDPSHRTLYLAASGREGNGEPTGRLAVALQARAPQIALTHVEFPGEVHMTIYHPAALDGFRKVLAPLKND